MTSLEENWRLIEAQFDDNEDLTVEEMVALLGADAGLVPETAKERIPQLLSSALDAEDGITGGRLSKYRVLERLESGGQGEVYLAERDDGIYRASVIIKLFTGRYASADQKRRFLEEMQFLADLNHPGVVKIIDAGLTGDERPWLVLEHIDGQHMDAYCRERKLTPDDIARLFIRLCDTLDFVHLRGIVHLDLKPGNVMVREVSGAPLPVIIDFGIALRDTDKDSGTRYGSAGFVAPEQIAGAPVDARADIYSVGMLLACVLTNGLGDTDSPAALTARLRANQVPADLQQIIRTCIHNDPQRRYADVATLRADLNNWRNDLPLLANRNRPLHVVAKSITRHPRIWTMALLALTALLFMTHRYTVDVQDLQQRTLAEKNAGDAMTNFMLTELFERLKKIGRVDVLEIIAERSIEHLDQQSPDLFDDEARLQTALAYRNSGRVLDALESSAEAQLAYDQAEAQLEILRTTDGDTERVLRELARLNILRAESLTMVGQGERTEKVLEEAITLASQLPKTPDSIAETLLWEANLLLGWHHMEYDQPDRADQYINRSLTVAETALAAQADAPERNAWRLHLSHSLQAQAWHAFDYGDPADAVSALDRALDLARLTVDDLAEDIEYLSNLRVLLNQKAFILIENDQLDDAQAVIDDALAQGERLALMAPFNGEYQREMSYSLSTGGSVAEERGDFERALAMHRRSLAISRDLHAQDTGGFSSANDLAVDLTSVANALAALGRREEAVSLWEQAVAVMRPVQSAEPDNKYYTYALVIPLLQLGLREEAVPLLPALRDSGMEDEALLRLLSQNNLE